MYYDLLIFQDHPKLFKISKCYWDSKISIPFEYLLKPFVDHHQNSIVFFDPHLFQNFQHWPSRYFESLLVIQETPRNQSSRRRTPIFEDFPKMKQNNSNALDHPFLMCPIRFDLLMEETENLDSCDFWVFETRRNDICGSEWV